MASLPIGMEQKEKENLVSSWCSSSVTSVCQDDVICRFFLYGTCKDGESCLFSHDRTRRIPDTACRYYLEEKCLYGQSCRLEHIANAKGGKNNKEEWRPSSKEDICPQKNLTCGICMEVVMEKEPVSERIFGVLQNCPHVYCLSCIRQRRQSRQFKNNDPLVTRACPECGIVSDFVTPSIYFVDTIDEKQKLITQYKETLKKTPCKYFKEGEGTCRLGALCFYLHAKPDGTQVNLPLPVRRQTFLFL